MSWKLPALGAASSVLLMLPLAMKGVSIGVNCKIGDHCFTKSGVIVGNNMTIKNGNVIGEAVILEGGVFVGPHLFFKRSLSHVPTIPSGKEETQQSWMAFP